MNNVIKKIASIAMAFTLLGTGTAVTKTISPKSDNTLVAQAYIPSQHCKHNKGSHIDFVGGYIFNSYIDRGKGAYARDYYICCNKCGAPLSDKHTVWKPTMIEIINWAVNYDNKHK